VKFRLVYGVAKHFSVKLKANPLSFEAKLNIFKIIDKTATLQVTEKRPLIFKIIDKMATKEKAVEAYARVSAIALLLKDEHASTTAQEAEVVVAALHLTPTTASSSVSPPPCSEDTTTVIATLHAEACGV
jgi:hypothetical protein